MKLGVKPHEEDCETGSPPQDSLPWEATKRVRFIYKTVMTLDARAAAQGRRHVNSCQMMLFVL